ncbi:hypothetical protein EDD85DRAFT_959834 [Armillaria nabsnona]|nr:hypothetical protein EDD85DRAFT_959834 [Armillaria nabsnona]
MTATSGKEKDLRFMVPHSKNGRYMSLGQVGMVGGTEQSHVEWEWWAQRSYIDSEEGTPIIFIVSYQGPDVAPAYLLNLSYFLCTPAALTIHHSPAILYSRAPHHCRAFPAPPIIAAIIQFIIVIIYATLLVDMPSPICR